MSSESAYATGTRRREKGPRTRARILEVALEAFGQSGYYGVSLQDIARRAGLTNAGLLHHFSSKGDVLLSVLQDRDDMDLTGLAEIDEDTDLRLLLWALATIERNLRTPGSMAIFVALSSEATDPEHPAHDYFMSRNQRIIDAMGRTFAEAYRTRPHPERLSPKRVARQFIALKDGLQLQWMISGGDVDVIGELLDFLSVMGIDISRDTVRTLSHSMKGSS